MDNVNYEKNLHIDFEFFNIKRKFIFVFHFSTNFWKYPQDQVICRHNGVSQIGKDTKCVPKCGGGGQGGWLLSPLR